VLGLDFDRARRRDTLFNRDCANRVTRGHNRQKEYDEPDDPPHLRRI